MKGYRILKPNEIVRDTDQAYDTRTRGWYYAKNGIGLVGVKVGSHLTSYYQFAASRFRRAIKS
jgi:hypothetical protein